MKIDRLLGILTTLLSQDKVTAPFLAEKFEVSRRTVGRDIEALCQAGIPVVTEQGWGGGISIAQGYKLDKSVLTADELSSLCAALRGIGSVSEPSGVERLLEKLSVTGEAVLSLKESVVIDLASHYRGSLPGKMEKIKQAVRESRLVSFDYYSEKGQSRRTVEPCFLTFQWTAWYLLGYCLAREDWRLFKLNRLWDLELGAPFSPRTVPPEKADFYSRLADDKKLVALFSPVVRYRLIDEYGPACYTEEEDGLLRLEIGYTNRDYITRWLLGFGDKVRVLYPEDLAHELRETGKKIASLYR